MAKARSRVAARKVKDRWKAKNWYNVLAPASFDNATIAETLADEPVKLIDRITEISLQDLTNDFRKSHIKLFFRIYQIEDSNAKTKFIGHTLTSDYLRRMIRRRRSKIDAVYDVKTRDGARVRVKPFATTDQRIQNSQKKVIRFTMRKTIFTKARAMTLSEFIKYIIEGKLGSDIFKSCKSFYPIRRVEIHKTQVLQQPTIEIEEPKPTDKIGDEVKSEEESEEKLESSGEELSDDEILQESEEELIDEDSEEIIKEEKPDETGELEPDETEELEPDETEELEPDETEELEPDETEELEPDDTKEKKDITSDSEESLDPDEIPKEKKQ